jgi:alpha-galactosidase
MPQTIDRAHFLANEASAVVFSVREGALPQIVHWGAPLGDAPSAAAEAIVATSTPSVMNSSFDTPRSFSILPTEIDGWSGTPWLA